MSKLDTIIDRLEMTYVALNSGITKSEAKAQIKSLILELMEDCDDWTDDGDGDEIRIFDEDEFERRVKAL